MRHLSVAAVVAAALSAFPGTAAAAPASFAALSELHAVGKVTVRIANGNNEKDVTNGGVAGRGHFTASGAITDKGTTVTYRTVKGSLPGGLITLRFVCVGKKGSITFVAKIDTSVGTSLWTIASGTKAYKGLHGKGSESDTADFTISTLTGTVAR